MTVTSRAETIAPEDPDEASSRHHDLAAGRAVLRAEAEALEALSGSLDDRFVTAIDTLAAVADRGGRVIVAGMGKSGHVGRKIAATLASTGTPAQFVHPAEASHGDLGMITERDAVMAISNSGETHELTDMIAHVKRFRIPLVAITSRSRSALAEAASVALILPDRNEAGAMGLAPTTSTTMTLALGDALAVALLERKGFTSTDFKALHPGGKLGKQLMRISDLMHGEDELPLVPLDAGMDRAVLTMTSKHFGCTGVVDKGKLVGVVTDGDLRRHMSHDLTDRAVAETMTADPVTVKPETMAAEVLSLMQRRKIHAVFVVDEDGAPIGIVNIHDILRAGVA
jgi:arabinose-5-phosphate isomerase